MQPYENALQVVLYDADISSVETLSVLLIACSGLFLGVYALVLACQDRERCRLLMSRLINQIKTPQGYRALLERCHAEMHDKPSITPTLVPPGVPMKKESQPTHLPAPFRAAEPPLSIYQRPLSGQSFLVVDANDEERHAMSTLIKMLGGLVDEARACTEALEAIGMHHYDAVMINSESEPEKLDGFTVAVKSEAGQATTIIVTGDDESQGEMYGQVDKFLTNACSKEELVRSLIQSGRYQVEH